jgi:hypothetical protein
MLGIFRREAPAIEGILPGNLAVIALSSLRSIGFASPPFGEFAFFQRDWPKLANPGYFSYILFAPGYIVLGSAPGWNEQDVLLLLSPPLLACKYG